MVPSRQRLLSQIVASPEEGEGASAPINSQAHQHSESPEQVAPLSEDKEALKMAIDRRQGNRRSAEEMDRDPLRPPIIKKQTVVPADWGWMGAFIVISIAVLAVTTSDFPPKTVLFGMAVATLIASSCRVVVRLETESNGSNKAHIVLAWTTVLLPMVMFGAIMGYWSRFGMLDWRWAVACIISATALSSSLLSKRVPQQLSAQVACWVPLALMEFSVQALTALAGLAISVIFVGRHQYKVALADAKREETIERMRNRAEDILRDYEETGQGWFWETDRRGQLTYLSTSVAKALNKARVDLLQTPFTSLFNLKDGAKQERATLEFHLSSRSAFQEIGMKANIAHGEERWWSVSGRPAWDSYGNFLGFRGSGTDLTEKKRSEESVTRLAQYDSLTNLANRLNMQQSLEKILAAPIVSQRECSVFLLDLDRFKQVNDTLGHPAGDALLKQVSQRLQNTVGEAGRVGRLGGDEFEVIIPGRWERPKLKTLAESIILTLSQPYNIDGHRVSIGASVGVAVAPADGTNSEEIIRNADLALYAAKDGGRGRAHFYSKDLHSAAEERAKLEQDLRDAITKGHLQLFYQPVVEASENKIAGFEALIRWQHPEHGWLSPTKFIPIAEDTGLINVIGEWAIRTACADLATWPEEIRCAVNVSPLQFSNPQLPAVVTNAVASSGIHPSRLELEITESVFLGENEATEAMFTALKGVGVRLALDDFGTGYSSLGYLKKAPFDKIKIDQSFVRGATEPGNRNAAIITSITGLAESLGMDTTAEGVETLDELELVRCLGCSHVQGYIFAKAMPSNQVTEMLSRGLVLTASGPKSARSVRHSVMRRVMIEHEGEYYEGTIRNLSNGGALVEGLWNVPEGTRLNIALSTKIVLQSESVWSKDDKMGVRFIVPIELDKTGQIRLKPNPVTAVRPSLLKKTANS